MPYEFYKVAHFLGLALVVGSLCALAVHGANGGTRETNKTRGLLAASHGIGLLLMLVAGFGALAKIGGMSGGAVPVWVWIKLLVWFLLGGALPLVQRKPELGRIVFFVVPLLAATAGWVAVTKPGAVAAAPRGE